MDDLTKYTDEELAEAISDKLLPQLNAVLTECAKRRMVVEIVSRETMQLSGVKQVDYRLQTAWKQVSKVSLYIHTLTNDRGGRYRSTARPERKQWQT